MLTVSQITDVQQCATESLTLPFALRQRSRLKATLDNGEGIGLFLPRGTVLREGDKLMTETGVVIEVKAAREYVSTAVSDDRRCVLRAAYHLGNRHTPVQVGDNWLRYISDTVLDNMVVNLGLMVEQTLQIFEPEVGAYASHH